VANIKIEICREGARVPSAAYNRPAGYDITVLELLKTIGDVEFYGTGLKVEPENGFYLEVVPRSSISKTGYVLANSIGIIDPDYRGEIIVALRRMDKSMPSMKLPATIAQIIVRKMEDANFEVVDNLSQTERGAGGYGSSDKEGW
jgi:dUTP pyrophosphatase